MQLERPSVREETPVVPPRPPTTNPKMSWEHVLQHGTFRLRGLEKFVFISSKEGVERREADKQVYAVVIFVVIAITVIIVITLITIAMVIVAALHIPNHILIHATSGAWMF